MSERTKNPELGMDPEFELQLGNFCNNRCVFCSSGQDTEEGHAGIVPLEQSLAALDKASKDGFRKVTFLGGEPTLYDTFLPSLKHAIAVGFDEIVIFTNGARAKDPRWINDVVSLGTFTWRFSIQGGNEETHDRVTQRKGSFSRVIKALENLNRVAGQRITSNMCVNEHSFRSLPDLPGLAAKYNLVQICIDMIGPSRAGIRTDTYLREIMAKYTDIAVYLDHMLLGFEEVAPKCEINVTNIPICVLPQWAHSLSYGGERTRTYTVDGEDHEGDIQTRAFDKYAYQSSNHRQMACCEECVFQPLCSGVQAKYLELFGADEFAPVSREQLLELDAGRQRLFSLLARPYIEPLTATEPPSGWLLGPIQGNNRDRRLDIRCEHEHGAVFLGFSPLGERGPHIDHWSPILVTDKYEMRVMMTPGADNAPIADIAEWAQDILVVDSKVEVMQRSSWSSRPQSDRLTRARRRLARTARAFLRLQKLEGWKISGTQVAPSRLTIRFTCGSGDAFDLVLTANEDESLPLVSASFECAEGTDVDDVRTPIEQLTLLLRQITKPPTGKELAGTKPAH